MSDELGMPVPASRSAAVRAATAVPMTRNPACSQAIRVASSSVVLPVPAWPITRS